MKSAGAWHGAARCIAAAFIGIAACAAVSAQSAASGPTPYPTDPAAWPGEGFVRVFGWMNDNRNWFWTQRERSQGSVVFAGDSLTGQWRTVGNEFPGIAAANRGIGGETSRMLLFRFKEDVLDLHPRAIVILIGTNDLSALQDVRQTAANIAAMLAMARTSAPGVPVVLCTIPPRNDPRAPIDNNRLIEINRLIASMAQPRDRVVLLDLHALMLDGRAAQVPEYFAADRLHLSAAGYAKWREALQPIFRQLKLGGS